MPKMTIPLRCWLALQLALQSVAQTPNDVKNHIFGQAPDTRIEVRLIDNTKLKGRLGSVFDNSFELKIERKDSVEVRPITFDSVKSLQIHPESSSQHNQGKTVGQQIGTALVITYAVVGAIGLVAIVVAAVHKN